VSPAHLREVGEALVGHPEFVFAAATTGPSNLVAQVVCRDTDALYELIAGRIGALPGVERAETSPVVRTVKRERTVTRLPARVDPAPPRPSRFSL
jgi:DNA-binding Lrp family transcriptional regulator